MDEGVELPDRLSGAVPKAVYDKFQAKTTRRNFITGFLGKLGFGLVAAEVSRHGTDVAIVTKTAAQVLENILRYHEALVQTKEQREALQQINQLREEIENNPGNTELHDRIVRFLLVGSEGVILRDVPHTPTGNISSDHDAGYDRVASFLEPGATYQGEAIVVKGGNPEDPVSNKLGPKDWYFMVTGYGPDKKATSGVFAIRDNFSHSSPNPEPPK